MVDGRGSQKPFVLFLRKDGFLWKNIKKTAIYRINLSQNNMRWMYPNSPISLSFI